MFKTDIEFSNKTLFVNVEGPVTKRNLKKLRKKLYYISDEYNIKDVVVSTKKGTNINQKALFEFLNEYDDLYENNLTLIE